MADRVVKLSSVIILSQAKSHTIKRTGFGLLRLLEFDSGPHYYDLNIL
jgi:hypothetical protein